MRSEFSEGHVHLTMLVAMVAAIIAGGVGALLANISERKAEAKQAYFRVTEIDDETEDPAVWGKNFPSQYDSYKRTVEMVRTRFGGSEVVSRKPTPGEPRTVVSQSKIEEDPRLKTMWAGYAFAKDFREERGHAYMLEDQTFTGRHAVPQPGTCIHCHGSVYVPYKKMGDGDLIKGFERMNSLPYAEARKHVKHPISCIDCHEPKTMRLRVTRPAFLEGIRAYKASQEGVEDYDPNTMATRQQMRTFVCAQCHVEYYFKGKGKRLVYPWSKGLDVDSILSYYDEVGHVDWVHKDTGAKVLKAQHPEFEMWSRGIHARSGVACADCHMPYKREGAVKVSDHHVRSPLLSLQRACQTCHRVPEAELKARVERIQATHHALRDQAMDALVSLIGSLKKAKDAGRADRAFRQAQDLQRKAQFKLDFVEAENSAGFHAPQESARILGEAINLARQGQIVLSDPDFRVSAPAPGPRQRAL